MLAFSGLKMQTNTEYISEELKEMVSHYADFFKLDCATFVFGKGHRTSVQQLQYETLLQYATKLDEYIAVVDVNQYRSDMDCFIPLMEEFKQTYGFYPEYPTANAGYRSYNNYLYCEQHNMKKYMKFPMFFKKITDKKYHENRFRAVNFNRNVQGDLICPNGKRFVFSYRKNVRGNQYGRQEEVYTCKDCRAVPMQNNVRKRIKIEPSD